MLSASTGDIPAREENAAITRGQSEDKVETNRRQSRDKVETNRRQTGDNYLPVKTLTGDKVETQPETQLETNWRQTGDKLETKTSISSLVGLQRNTLLYCYDSCKKTRSKRTEPLVLSNISSSLQSSICSIKKSIQRLEEKIFLIRVLFKNGRSGWTVYELPDWIYQDLLQMETEDKLRTNWRQSRDKLGTEVGTEVKTTSSSSSSNYVLEDFKTTTTGETKTVGYAVLQLRKEWLEIDFSSLAEIHFSVTQLSQIAQLGKLTPTEVQDSIDAFAFDLKKNQRTNGLKTSPLNFFMGILRRGMPYTPPENYESPQDEARRKYLESKRAQLSRRQAMEKEIVELEFQEWKGTLSVTQRKALAPHAKIEGSEMQTSTLREYFLSHIYSQRRSESVEVIHRHINQSLGIVGTNE
jgi:hypothetical protein